MSNTYRKLLADAIESNGGYSRGYHDRYALSWDVSVNSCIPDFDDVVKRAMGNEYCEFTVEEFNAVVTAEQLEKLKEEWDDDHYQSEMWNWVIEDMARGLTDGDTYRTMRPELFKRYGLSYERWPRKFKRITKEMAYHPAKVGGWMKESPYDDLFDVKWEFAGRGGKHLCLAEFEGHSLNVTSDELAEAIRDNSNNGYYSSDYPNEWCQKLVAFIHECDLCFTHKAVKEEFDYQVDFRLAQNLNDAYNEAVEAKKEKEAVEYFNSRDIITTTN